MANAVKMTAYLTYAAALFIFLSSPTTAEVLGFGSCPTVAPLPQAQNPPGLQGTTWYEQRRYDSLFQSSVGCVEYKFGTFAAGVAPLDITGVNRLTGRIYQFHGMVTAVPSTSPNVFAVNYNSLIFPQQFIIIGGVAGKWVVFYSCTNYGFFHFQQVIVLTTARIPSQADIEAAYAAIRTSNLPVWTLREVEQAAC